MLSERLTIYHVSFCYWLLIIGIVLCPILCIGSPKDLRFDVKDSFNHNQNVPFSLFFLFFRFVCLISVLLVALVFVLISTSIVLDGHQEIVTRGDDCNLTYDLLKLYGIITFQFDIHPTILTVQMDMKKKDDVNKAILWGYLCKRLEQICIC